MNVLVVDDQYEVTQAVIDQVDWNRLSVDQVFPAYSVKGAMQVFLRERVDILLCDIEMPPSTGFELVDWAQERWPDLITIFLSSHADFEYAQRAVKLGSYDYVLQPAPYEEIERAVERAVSRAGESRKRYAAQPDQPWSLPDIPAEQEKARPVEKAMEYIRRHLDRDLSRSEIAESVYLNPEYLSHLFKQDTGVSLMDFITAERLKIAKSLLELTDIKVSLIAARVGFASFSYFSQVFKKHTGVTPLEYRARYRENK